MDCKGIILDTWVQKGTLLLQNRGHAEVLKKTPSAKYVTQVRPPSAPECPPPPPPNRGALPVFYFHVILDYSFTEQILRLSECMFANNEIYPLSASVTKTSQILYVSIAHVQISRVNKKINTFSPEGCKYAGINQLFNSKNNLVDIFFNF